MFFFNQTPSNITIRAESPLTVKQGEQFTFKIIIENLDSQSQSLQSIDFTGDYVSNIAIMQTDPPWVQSQNMSFLNLQSYVYNRHLPAGAAVEIVFHARALNLGDHMGGYDVSINNDFEYLSDTIRTIVLPADEDGE